MCHFFLVYTLCHFFLCHFFKCHFFLCRFSCANFSGAIFSGYHSIYYQRAGKTIHFHMRGGRFHAGNTLCTFKRKNVRLPTSWPWSTVSLRPDLGSLSPYVLTLDHCLPTSWPWSTVSLRPDLGSLSPYVLTLEHCLPTSWPWSTVSSHLLSGGGFFLSGVSLHGRPEECSHVVLVDYLTANHDSQAEKKI